MENKKLWILQYTGEIPSDFSRTVILGAKLPFLFTEKGNGYGIRQSQVLEVNTRGDVVSWLRKLNCTTYGNYRTSIFLLS